MTKPAHALLSGWTAARSWVPLALGVALFAAAPAAAQSSADIQQLLNRLSRIERDMQTLSSQVYRGQPPAGGGAAGPGLSGDYATQVEVRLQDIERQLQLLTGRIEEISHANQQLSGRFDRALNDLEFRLTELENRPAESPAGAAGATGGAAAGAATAAAGDGGAAGAGAAAPAGAAATAGTLGTLPGDAAPGQPGPDQGQAATGAGGTAAIPARALPDAPIDSQYNYAYGLLTQGEYEQAEQALRQFLDAHPDQPLASNAQYWLGETYYIRGRFNDAAIAFAQGYQNYPSGSKAVDSLLKLGMSLSAMGQTEDACLTFSQIRTEFPQAPAGITRRAEQERSRLQCG